jgi:GH24 family phage-related lysozyme (muramidase)
MQLNVNFGNQMAHMAQMGRPMFGGGMCQPSPMLAMMSQMLSMMMTMMGQMGGGCPCGGAGMSPFQNPGFGGCQNGAAPGNFGCGSPLNGFLGGGQPHYHGGGQPHYHSGGQPHYHGGGQPHYHGGGQPHYHGGGQPHYHGGGHSHPGGLSPHDHGSFQPSGPAGHPLSARAVELIAKSEGFDQPGKWPGYKSGITIGVGYDLGHMTREQLYKDWQGKIPDAQLARLSSAIGLKGQSARAAAGQFRDIQIPKNAALDVFHTSTLPSYYKQACKAFPGMDRLPPDAQGSLTSLVFNRGASMSGDRRTEMRQIRGAVQNYQGQSSLDYMADRIRSMKRLWAGQGVDGLLTRRDNEAAMLQRSNYS